VLKGGSAPIAPQLPLEPFLIEDDAEGITVACVSLKIGPSAEDLDKDPDDTATESSRLDGIAERGANGSPDGDALPLDDSFHLLGFERAVLVARRSDKLNG